MLRLSAYQYHCFFIVLRYLLIIAVIIIVIVILLVIEKAIVVGPALGAVTFLDFARFLTPADSNVVKILG